MTKKEKVDELIIANEEKEKRADELIMANKELAYQNGEKEKQEAMNISPLKSLPNLLIVEDNSVSLTYLEIVLKKLKVNLIKAESGFDALEKTKGLELALAILDVRMPGMDGYELALKMNEERSGEKVPIIFLTENHINEMQVFKGYDSGAVDYLFKSIDNQILLCKVNVFLDLFNQKQTIIRDAALLKKSADELTRVNATLKVSEEKYRTMLNASPDGILLIDLKGIITEVSEIGIQLFGADISGDLMGKNIQQFIAPGEKKNFREILKKTLNEGLVQNYELVILKKNKDLMAGEISTTLIQRQDGAPVSYMIIVRDITQRKKAETKQIHADRMVNLGEMASGIAHEINQPLNIISMVMDKILFESSKTKFIDIEFFKIKSDKIFENITRIKNIIDHIRAFSRSHDDYVLTAFDINSSIENAASMVLEQFKHLGIELDIQLGKQIPQIIGNTYKFEQVIINLLVNAKDAVIEKKSKKPEYTEMIIGIRSYLENQFIVVEINDNGFGISDNDINNVMLPFFTTKDEGQGTGLGLSICYQIIKEMNGTIDIKSKSFIGTKIKIVLDIEKNK